MSPAFSLFDPALRQTLVRYARRRVPAADVEDVVQETLCDALGSQAMATKGELVRWSLTILRRRIVDLYRARARAPLALALAGCVPADDLGARDPGPELEARDFLHRLDFSHDAMGLILAESAGEPLESAARESGLTPEAARQRVSRHRKRLRVWLAAAASFSILALLGHSLSIPHDIEAEPVVSVAVSDLSAVDGLYTLSALDPDSSMPAPLRELALGFVGAAVRIEHGSVTVRGRSLLQVDSLAGGIGLGHDVHGAAMKLFVRGAGASPASRSAQLHVESWDGTFRGRLTLQRVP